MAHRLTLITAACAVLALSFVGCAPSTPATPESATKEPAKETAKAETPKAYVKPDGWIDINTEGVAMAAPEGWEALDFTSDEVAAMLQGFVDRNPGLQGMAAQLQQIAESGAMRVMVFAPLVEGANFRNNFNLVVTDAPGKVSVGELRIALKPELQTIAAPGTEIATSEVTFPSGTYAQFDYHMVQQAVGGEVKIKTIAYVMEKDGKLYNYTFSAGEDPAKDAENSKLFASIMESVRVN